MLIIFRHCLLPVLLIQSCLFCSWAHADKKVKQYYHYQHGLLGLFVNQISTKSVLQEVCRLTDISLKTYGDLSEKVTLSFHEKSIPEAIKLIVADRPFVIIYEMENNVNRISELRIYTSRIETKQAMNSLSQHQVDEMQWIDYLSKRPEQEAVDELGELLSDSEKDAKIKQYAIKALSQYNSKPVAGVLAFGLSDQRQEIRTEIVHALAQVKNDQSLNILAQIFYSDSNPELRLLAIKKMAAFNTPASKAFLQSALDDENETIRLEARYALDGLIADR